MLEHQDAVADRQGQGPAASPLAEYDHHDRRPHGEEALQVVGDRPRLAAFLRFDARVCSRRVDDRENGQVELLGQAHHPERLPEPLGTGHAEIPLQAIARPAALLVPDDDEAPPADAREPGDHGRVVAEEPVAVQLPELVADHLEQPPRRRPKGMPGEQDVLPGREVAVHLALEGEEAVSQPAKLPGAVLVPVTLEVGDPALELLEGPFEIEIFSMLPGHLVSRPQNQSNQKISTVRATPFSGM